MKQKFLSVSLSLLLISFIVPYISSGQIILLGGNKDAGFSKIKKDVEEFDSKLVSHPNLTGYSINSDTDGVIFSAWGKGKEAVQDVSSFVRGGGKALMFLTNGAVYNLSEEISNAFGVSLKRLPLTMTTSFEISNSVFSDDKVSIGCKTAWYTSKDKSASNRVTCSGSEAHIKVKDKNSILNSKSFTMDVSRRRRSRDESNQDSESNKKTFNVYIKKKHGKGEIVVASIYELDSSFRSNLFFNDKNYAEQDNPEAAKNMIKWLLSDEK